MFFWTLLKNVHCQGPCSLRPCISRPYCTWIFHENFHKTNSVRCYLLVKLGKSFVQIGSLTKSSWVKTFNLQKGFASHIGNLEETKNINMEECYLGVMDFFVICL